jgi:signal transduction histidine kinase/FixJ family two-component response regulator
LASGLPQLVGINLAKSDYITAVLKDEQFFIGDVTEEYTNGIPTIFISFPVYNSLGNFTGIIAAGLRLDKLFVTQGDAELSYLAKLVAFDKHGALAFKYPETYAPSSEELEQSIKIINRIDQEGVVVLDKNTAQERFFIYRSLRFSPEDELPYLYLCMTMDTSSAFADTYVRLFGKILLLLGAVALGCTLAWYFGQQTLGQPVEQLIKVAQYLQKGDLTTRADLHGLQGEMGTLATAFNEMACSLEQHEAEINEAKRETDSANQAKTEFLANISHEIRTPLNAIIGMAYLALKTELSDKQRDYIDKIYLSGNALLVIINDLLDFSKIETGKLSIETSSFLLCDVFKHLSSIVAPAAKAKGLDILFAVDPAVPQNLKGDSTRLSQILNNIVGNAVKFTEYGEILINCALLPEEQARPQQSNGQQAVSASSNKARKNNLGLQFLVHDTGIGMSAEQLSELFTPFKQIDGTITRKYGGTGLGLALTRKLVEMMDGEISISSAVNEGTDVFFTVFVETAAQPHNIFDMPNLKGLRVLLVDDNATARQVISGMLTGLKLDVHTVDSAKAAYAKLTEAEEKNQPYKLLLLDWRMPEINGLEAAKHIKNNLRLLERPIMLLVTAFGQDEITFSKDEYGLSSIIYKPVSPSQLLNAILEALIEDKNTGDDNIDNRPDDLILTDSALPNAPGVNTTKALERLGGNERLYYALAQQFCARHSKDDERIDKAITYGDLQQAAEVAHSIKGLSATLGAETLSLKASRIQAFINQSEEPNDEFYWLFDGFCAEFSTVLNLLQQSLQLCGLNIVVQDAHNIKGSKLPAAESSEATQPAPEPVQSVITPPAQTSENIPDKTAVPAETLQVQENIQTDVQSVNNKQTGLSGAVLDIIMALKLKMEDDDASAMTYIQSNLDALSKEIPPAQLHKLTQAVESFDYSAGLESLEGLLP